MEPFAILLYLVGSILTIIGAIGLVIEAFHESTLWGLGCLLLAPVILAFIVFHWEDAKKAFSIWLIGLGMIFLAVFMRSL